jgi:hypothetical protein
MKMLSVTHSPLFLRVLIIRAGVDLECGHHQAFVQEHEWSKYLEVGEIKYHEVGDPTSWYLVSVFTHVLLCCGEE